MVGKCILEKEIKEDADWTRSIDFLPSYTRILPLFSGSNGISCLLVNQYGRVNILEINFSIPVTELGLLSMQESDRLTSFPLIFTTIQKCRRPSFQQIYAGLPLSSGYARTLFIRFVKRRVDSTKRCFTACFSFMAFREEQLQGLIYGHVSDQGIIEPQVWNLAYHSCRKDGATIE